MQKTFAEKLKEHTKYCAELMDQARELVSQAKIEKENGNSQQYGRLTTKAGKLIKLVETVIHRFDIEHDEQLKTLARIATK